MSSLQVLCAGAARGLVSALGGQFLAESGFEIRGTFGAVGSMREKLLAGEACDLIVLTDALIGELARDGWVDPASRVALGRVRTGIAARAGDPVPGIADAQSLRDSLMRAAAIYLPDPQRATAGIHFVKVLRDLGIEELTASRLRPFASGAAAMQAMAASGPPGSIGCTQVTEINYTEDVVLAGPLPARFELCTTYCAAVCTRAAEPDAARKLATLISGPGSAAIRALGGFEPLLAMPG